MTPARDHPARDHPARDHAAREYKAIIARITEAADGLREADRRRAAELARELVAHDDTLARAGERAALTRFGVALYWEAALEALWAESWMTLRPVPAPDESADATALDVLDAAVEHRLAELQEAVRRRGLGLRRR